MGNGAKEGRKTIAFLSSPCSFFVTHPSCLSRSFVSALPSCLVMTSSDVPVLNSLEFIPYITGDGLVPEQFQGKIGVYAIFDQAKELQYVGYSRDVWLSLKQHLVRHPLACHWIKAMTIDRPNRTLLETIRDSWIQENNTLPPNNRPEASEWNDAINVKQRMTPEEGRAYEAAIDEVAQIKVLKQAARRVEAEILAVLQERGVREEIRFNPKLKESGLLDLK